MTKIRKIITFICLVFLVSPLTPVPVAAETIDTVPTIYVKNITLSKNNFTAGDNITGTFILSNNGPVPVSDIVYKISLVGDYQKNGLPSTLYDSHTVSQSDALNGNQQKIVSFSYTIPSTTTGKNLGIQIRAMLKSGILLGWSDSPRLNIIGGISGATVSKVSITVDGQSFPLQAGPTIQPYSTTTLEVSLTNSSANTLTLTPQFKVYDQTTSGTLLTTEQETGFTINSNTSKVIVFNKLPTLNNTPHVYDTVLTFVDGQGTVRSAPLEFRYIVAGDIATVRSITSSVGSVINGDSFKLLITYDGAPADVVTKKVPHIGIVDLNVKVFNENNDVVGESHTTINIDTSNSHVVAIVATGDAQSLRAEVKLSKNGKILNTYSSGILAGSHFMLRNFFTFGMFLSYSIVIIVLLLIIVVITRTQKILGKNAGFMILAIAFLGGGLMIHLVHVSASTFTEIFNITNDPDPANSNNYKNNPWKPLYASPVTFVDGNSNQVIPSSNDNFQLNSGQSFWIHGDVYAQGCSNSPQFVLYKTQILDSNNVVVSTGFYGVYNLGSNITYDTFIPSGDMHGNAFIGTIPGHYKVQVTAYNILGKKSIKRFQTNYPTDYTNMTDSKGETVALSLSQASFDSYVGPVPPPGSNDPIEGDLMNVGLITQGFDVIFPTATANLYSDKTTVNAGDTAHLTWTSSNIQPNSCIGTNFDTRGQDSNITGVPVTPSVNTTYTLMCKDLNNQPVSSSVSIAVNTTTQSPTVSLVADPNPVDYNNSTNLTWTSQNATACTGTNFSTGPNNAVNSTGAGVQSANLKVPTIFSIQCTGPGGSVTQNLRVGVNLPPPSLSTVIINSCTSNPPTKAGLGKQIVWTVDVSPSGGNHIYTWTGDVTNCDPSSNMCTMKYTVPGTKHVFVAVDGIPSPAYACTPLNVSFTEVEK